MIFKVGSQGENVFNIQSALKALGLYQGIVDGVFGEKTQNAVIEFQKKRKLNADGIVGPLTWEVLFPKTNPHLPEILVPRSRDEVYQLFGDPLDSGYWKAYGGFCETPSELNHVFSYQLEGKNGFWCNKLLIPIFQNVYNSIALAGLSSKLISFDGCWNVRYIRGGNQLSMHSWGIAVDHNAQTNSLGSEGDMNMDIVELFESEGFFWGGNFKRKDPMHFEFSESGL